MRVGGPADGRVEAAAFYAPRVVITQVKARVKSSGPGSTVHANGCGGCCDNGGITSALIDASRSEQVIDCAGAVNDLDFPAAQLVAIDSYAVKEDINLQHRTISPDRPML